MPATETHLRRLTAPRQFSAAKEPPTSPRSTPEHQLWERAIRSARLGAHHLPGLVEVVEKVGPCPTQGDIAVYFSTRIAPDSRGQPMARLVESIGRRTETAFEPLVQHAHGLLDTVESALISADPLVGTATGGIQRSMERIVDGVRCIGFTAARRTAALDLEFSVWVAVQSGYAVRVDFRGANLHERASPERISSVYGMRRYDVDSSGRWLLQCQTDRITFVTDDPALPASGYAERTSSYSKHWDPNSLQAAA